MTTFILHHPIASLLIVAFFCALVALFVGGICHKAGAADEQIENFKTEMPPATFIEPQDLIEEKHPCAWCQMEQAIKAQPHESHGICKRHYDEKMAEIKQLNQNHK